MKGLVLWSQCVTSLHLPGSDKVPPLSPARAAFADKTLSLTPLARDMQAWVKKQLCSVVGMRVLLLQAR